MKKIGLLIIGLLAIFVVLLGAMYAFEPDTLYVNESEYDPSIVRLVYDGEKYDFSDIDYVEEEIAKLSESASENSEEASDEVKVSNNIYTFTKEEIADHGIYLEINGEKLTIADELVIEASKKRINVSYTGVDLYEVAPSITYDQIFDDSEGKNYYYYYQTSCSHCQALKLTMTNFYLDLDSSEDFYIIDMLADENQDAWYDWEEHAEIYGADSNDPSQNPNYTSDPAYMQSVEDIEITGTPTLVVTENGVVTEYLVGNDSIQALVEEES